MSEIARIWTFRVIRAFAVEEAGGRMQGAGSLPFRRRNIDLLSVPSLRYISLLQIYFPTLNRIVS